MLNLKEVTIRRGPRQLLASVNFTVHAGQHVGIVGRNGTGKSSLFALLLGELDADAGTVQVPAGLSIATVRQSSPSGRQSAIDFVLDGDAELRHVQGALATAESAGDGHALAELHARMADIDGYAAHARAARLLHGLGFAPNTHDNAIDSFSGGWRMRLNLAAALMCRSDLMLLDEPTNHLDARGLDYLTAMLRAHPGALAVVSHDRALLGEVATAYLDLDPTMDGSPLLVSGGLEAWQLARRRARAAWEDAYRVQREEHHRLSGHADAARSRLSTGWRPDKGTGKHQRQSRAPGIVRAMNERIQRLEEHRLDVPPPPPRLHLTDSGTPAGVPLLRADAVRVDQNAVRVDQPECVEQAESAAPPTDPESAGAARPRLERTTLRLEGGDRLLVVGPNGAGKTTLLRVLAGEVRPTAGTARVLGRARIALLEQEDEGPSAPSASPEAWSSSAPWTEHPPGRDQPAHRGSPGERRRRALSRLFAARPDVALLDEPTNHLGISGVDDLLAALESTSAAIVVATHDRSVLRALSHWPRLELGDPAPSR